MLSTKKVLDGINGAGFCVINLGCKVNRVESDTISASLLACGGHPSAEEDASVIVINTCTVTAEADKKARKAVRHALSVSPEASVVVTGCAVAIEAEAFSRIDERVLVVLRPALLAELNDRIRDAPLRFGAGFRTRVSVKVQDGCNRACTYCIVHTARGPATSAPLNEVLDECSRYLDAGVKEIVLTGIDLGSYRNAGATLSNLAESVLELIDKKSMPGSIAARVRASSLEPDSITDDFIELMARSDGKLCRHLHLPLQSGNAKVLREMARPYSSSQFLDLVEHLYSQIPTLSLTTDIICGFPGETADEFADTLEMAQLCKFSKIHVFPYSIRENTPAALRADQVPVEEKRNRARKLRELANDLRRDDLIKRKGTRELALVQDRSALTESYHEVPVAKDLRTGELVEISIE